MNEYVARDTRTGEIFRVGDTVTDFRGEAWVIKSFIAPRGASTGRIETTAGFFYPGCYNCQIVPADATTGGSR